MNAGRETAPVVVIGAGCIGAAIAYHLGRRGVKDVVVIERELFSGAGSTGKCAGGIRQQFSSEVNVRICQESVRQYEVFHEEMGTDRVFWQVGYLFLLSDPAQWAAFQASQAAAAQAQAAPAAPALDATNAAYAAQMGFQTPQ